MLIQKKKRYILSASLFVFLCAATIIGFILLKQNQDNRQQASGTCPANEPYCNGLDKPITTTPGSELNKKGIVSTTYTGDRATFEGGCGGMWMNNFCYMPGDELAGGKIIVASGRYDYPYIEDKKVYESVNFGAENISKVIGSTENLGNDCDGKGIAIGGSCYAYGATVNGYLVMPARTGNCNNDTGDYCYAHLEKIDVTYSEWQRAVDSYKENGDLKALEDLYKKTYGISFDGNSLYDSSSANASLLKAQAILSALTSASVLQQQAAAQNFELSKKGTLTVQEQATFDFNQQIINDANLANKYQLLDQLNDATSQQMAINTAIKEMYSDLVVAGGDAEMNRIAAQKFQAIFGYDPSSKYGNVNGILEAFGIDPAQLRIDRSDYANKVAEQVNQTNQQNTQQVKDFDKLNEEYQQYVSGESSNINDLKNAAITAGIVTSDQLRNLSETQILALLLSKFSGTTTTQAQQDAAAIVNARTTATREVALTNQYINNQDKPSSRTDLINLYTLYTGHSPSGQFTDTWLQQEVAKYNSQVALSLYAQTQDVSYLNRYYLNNSSSQLQATAILGDPEALLKNIYGSENGGELYKSIVLPNQFNSAVDNFAIDGGRSLKLVCSELGVTNCNLSSSNATQTISLMLDKMYGGQEGVNVPDLAVSYSNKIYADSTSTARDASLDEMGSMMAYSQVSQSNLSFSIGQWLGNLLMGKTDKSVNDFATENVSPYLDSYNEAQQAHKLALDAVNTFNASQTFSYATTNRSSLNDYTWGLSYGNALMADNIFDREFTQEEMGLNVGQTINLTFNQLSSQIAGVDVAQNIATNYATSKHYNYTGPADTGISNIALTGASNMGVLDYDYQSAASGYYASKTVQSWGEEIGSVMTQAGAAYAASQMNQAAMNQALYFDSEDITFIDPIEYANEANEEFRADYKQNMQANLYNNYIANTNAVGISPVNQATFEQFISDPEVQRSSQQLDYERLEKVVAPAAAVVVLPVMVASGVGVPVLLGAASSAFSLYQGAGMKAQALEIQRIDIDTRENAIVQSYVENGASAEEVEELRGQLNSQVETLNQQGNLMLANSAVAAFTSAGGWLSSAANLASGANTANVLATSGQVLTKVGQAGGIAMNSYNAVNSGISSYNAFNEGNYAQAGMSALSSFIAASGVAGNTFGLVGPTTYTNKIDYVLDAMNVPAGAAVDAQQVAQACYGSSGAFSEKDCTNAWIGLALSAGQNVTQISSSYKNYKSDADIARVTDIQKQIDAIDTEILALNGPNKGFRQGDQINALALQRSRLADQLAGINPNLKMANNVGATEELLAGGARVSAGIEVELNRIIDAGKVAESKYTTEVEAARNAGENAKVEFLTNQEAARQARQAEQVEYLNKQLEVFRDRPSEIAAVRDQITAIDEQISKRGVLLSETEVNDLQQQRNSLVGNLEGLVRDLSSVESLRTQNEAILKTVQENKALEDYQALLAADAAKAELVRQYAPENEEVGKYATEVEADQNLVRLETDPSKRLLSIAYLQDNLAKISDLETQKQELMINLGVENSQQVGRAIDRLSTEINELRNQGVLNEADTLKLADLETRRSDLQAETVKLEAIDSEIAGIRKITDTYSADSRSVFQKIADFFSPGKANREAYYKSMDLTRQAEELRTKLSQVGADSDDAKSLREKLAEVNRQLLDQQSILASAVSAKSSKNIIQRVAEFFANRTEAGQVNDLKKLAKKLGTRNLEVVDQINAKSAEIEKLRSEDALANEAAIKNLETEIATLRQEAASALKGNALISVDQSGEHTQYKVTEAGKKMGLNDEQLLILNDELKNFEIFKRTETGVADFKIYSNTGSFKDQDVFLLAEIEAFGVGRRGTVFGALPGMGKTDVVMPFNVLLKQRLTGAAQFVVFPEAKLMKPWVSDANYTPNKAFIDYVESRFGEGSVVIVKANDQNIDPVAIANAKFVITTKDVAFDLQNTSTRLGLNLRNKWKNSFVHADEVDWTFNPNENYKLSGAQVAIRDKAEFSLYADAQKQVIGIDENGQLIPGKGLSSLGSLINELSVSKSIPEGITRTSDGKSGKFADPELEKQVLAEWLGTWNGQSKIADLDLSADVATVRQKINNYLTNSADSDVHQHRAELAMINETVNFLSRVPGEDYGLTSNTKSVNGVDETINSIAPREQGRVSGRSYSAVAESLLYNTLGARVLGVNANVDLNKITVGESGSEINYALLMLESKGFSLYTGTPETVAKLYKMAYGIDLKIFTDSAVDDSIARFNAPPSGTASKVFVNLQDQILARLAENRNQVFINMASGVRSNEAALNDLAKTVIDTNAPYKKVLVIGANGELNEYQIVGSTLNKVATYPSTDDLNARTKQLDTTGERYIKFYEYGAHVGVDTANDVDISRAVGLCSGCDQTTFSQGINRVRVKVSSNGDGTSSVKYAPIDIVWLDAPSANRNPDIKDFSSSISERQTVNEALAEVSFKETLLKNSVDATFAELIDLARNGKKGFLGFGSYKVNSDLATQLEAAQQKWKETTGMNYLLGSDNMTAQAKLEKTASQVAATYEELTKMLTGSGEPAKLLAKRADGAVGNNQIRLSFAGDEGYQVLGENPSYRQIVDLINQSSKHLEGVKIAFVDRSSPAEVVANEVARTADNKTETETADTNAARDANTADTDINKVGDNADTTKGNDQTDVNNNAANKQTKSSNIGFATFVSNLWNGKVDEVKLLAENAGVVEKNKQAILTDYQNQIDILKENLGKATEQSEKDSLNSQINDLETAKNDESTVNAAAEQMTTEQLANNYRDGGLKNWLPKDMEKGGAFTVNAQPVADFLSGLSGGFNEEAFIADKQAEIDLTANQLKQSAIKEKLVEVESIDNEVQKLGKSIKGSKDLAQIEAVTKQIEALSKRMNEIGGEIDNITNKDFSTEATNLVREKYAQDDKYQKPTIGQRVRNMAGRAGNLISLVSNKVSNFSISTSGIKKNIAIINTLWNGLVDEETLLIDHADDLESELSRAHDVLLDQYIKAYAAWDQASGDEKVELAIKLKVAVDEMHDTAVLDDLIKANLVAKYADYYRIGGVKNSLRFSKYSEKIDTSVQERLLTEKMSAEEFLKNSATSFDASKEILVLRKTKPNSRERIILKKLFRERYAAQLVGLGLMRKEMEDFIGKNTNASLADLNNIFSKYQKQFALSAPYYQVIIETFYNNYQEHLLLVAEAKLKYENNQIALINDLFGKQPNEPFSIVFAKDYISIKFSKNDYESLVNDKSAGMVLSTNRLNIKSSNNGKVISDFAFAVNGNYPNEEQSIVAHERQHLLHSVMGGGANDFNSIGDINRRAVDEILAFFEGGNFSSDAIKNSLQTNLDGSKKDNYDFFAWAAINDTGLKAEYNRNLYAAIDAYNELLKLGFSYPEIRNLLELEDISRWPRLANRLTNIYSDYDLSHKLATLYKNIVPRDYFSKKLANLQSSSEKLSNSLAERIRLTWNDSSKKIQSVFNNSKQRASSALLATRGFFVNQTNRFSDFVKSLSKPTNNQQVGSTNNDDDSAGKTIIFSNVNSVKLTTIADLSIDQIKAMNPDKVSEVSYSRNSTPDNYPSRDSISRNAHAKVSINKNTGVLSIIDQKSTNGTYINGFRVAANTAYLLRDGDHVGIGIVPVSGGFKNAMELIVRTDDDGNYYLVDVNNYLKPQFFAVDRNNLDNTITLDQTDFIQLPSSKDTKNIIYSTEVIGRKTAANITDSRISREHLLVYHGNDGSLFVEDNNSSNGTFLVKNGTNNKVKLAKGEVVGLVPGDRIYLDSYELKVVYDKKAKAYVLVNNVNQLVKGAFVDAYESSKERDAVKGQNILSDDMREHLNNWGGIGTVVEDLVTKFSYKKLNQIWLYGPGSQKGRRTSVTTSGGEKISLQYKLHFAVAVEDFDEALAEMAAYLRTLDVLHKVAPGKLIVTDTNSKQFGKAITIYAQDPTIMELIANKSVELGKKYKGINSGEMARVGANLDYEVEVPGTNGLLYYTLENVYKNEFGGEVAYYLGGGRGGVYLDNQYYQGYASRKTLMNMFWGKGPLDSWINKNKDRFNSLCSDCEQVRSQTQNGVQLADNLLTEAENLNKQATEAKTAGNLKLANDLTKQADAKKQAALKQLNDTRFQVVNDHGMQNQCVQLYLNAWIDTREAMIRQTLADANAAIKTVHEATSFIRQTLTNGFMETKEVGLPGLANPSANIPLDDQARTDFQKMAETMKGWAEFKEEAGSLTEELISGELKTLRDTQLQNNNREYISDSIRILTRDVSKNLRTNLIADNQQDNLELALTEIQPIIARLEVGGAIGSITLTELNNSLAKVRDGLNYLKTSGFDQANILEKLGAFADSLQSRSEYLSRLKNEAEKLSADYTSLTSKPYTLSANNASAAQLILQIDKLKFLIESGGQIENGDKQTDSKDSGFTETIKNLGNTLNNFRKSAAGLAVATGSFVTGAYVLVKKFSSKLVKNGLQSVKSIKIKPIKIQPKKINIRLPRIPNLKKIILIVLSVVTISSLLYFSLSPLKNSSNLQTVNNQPAVIQTIGSQPKVESPVVAPQTAQVVESREQIINEPKTQTEQPIKVNPVTENKVDSDQVRLKAIEQKMDQILEEAPGQWGAYVQKINSSDDKAYTYRAEETFHAASTIKVPVAISVMSYFESKNISLDNALKAVPKGQDRNIEQLMKAMLIQSEEDATEILVNFVQSSSGIKINDYFKQIGMDEISYYPRSVSSTSMGHLLESFYTGQIGLSKTNTDYVLNLMRTPSKDDEYRIGGALPIELRANMAHKVGTVLEADLFTASDVAIVSLPNNEAYVIVVYNVLDNQDQYPGTPGIITEISKLALEMYSQDEISSVTDNISEVSFSNNQVNKLVAVPDSATATFLRNSRVETKIEPENIPELTFRNNANQQVSLRFSNDSQLLSSKDIAAYQSAFEKMAPFYQFLQTDQIRLTKVQEGSIDGGKDYYAITGSEILQNGTWLGSIKFTVDYEAHSHLQSILSNLGLADKADEAALIHEIAHIFRYERDANGNLVESSIITAFAKAFYEDQTGEKELPPTSYAMDYYKGKDTDEGLLRRAIAEDLSDSVALYLVAPEYLKQVAPLRYEFLNDVANGVNPNDFQVAYSNADVLAFNDLCSDCSQVRESTKQGVQIADNLMIEVESLSKEAEIAQQAGDQLKADELRRQVNDKKNAALEQLNKTRFQVINAHGMQNQCTQLYLNAWVNTREALIRRTKADFNQAVDSVYKATALAEEMLDSKKMKLVEGGFLGFGTKTKFKDLSEAEIEEITDLLFGNKDKGIEGLQSFASFVKDDTKLSKELIGGSLMDLEKDIENNFNIYDSTRVFFTSLLVDLKQRFFFNDLKNSIVDLPLSKIIGKSVLLVSETPTPSITISPSSITPTAIPSISITPSIAPVENEKSSISWKNILAILAGISGISLIGSAIYWNLPSFNPPQNQTQNSAIVEIKQEDDTKEEVSISPSPSLAITTTIEPTQSPSPKLTLSPKPTLTPVVKAPTKVERVILDTALPDRYIVQNPYASYEILPNGSYFFNQRDEWNPIDNDIFPSYTTNRNKNDYLKTIDFFQVEDSTRYRRTSSVTYCNIYVSDVTNALGVYIPRWLNGEKQNATAMLHWLENPMAQDLGWHAVSAQEAQILANQGIPTVAATEGHIAMVIPGSGENIEGVYYPNSAQAGSINFDSEPTYVGFKNALNRGQEIQYFANSSQYEFVQPGSNL